MSLRINSGNVGNVTHKCLGNVKFGQFFYVGRQSVVFFKTAENYQSRKKHASRVCGNPFKKQRSRKHKHGGRSKS